MTIAIAFTNDRFPGGRQTLAHWHAVQHGPMAIIAIVQPVFAIFVCEPQLAIAVRNMFGRKIC